MIYFRITDCVDPPSHPLQHQVQTLIKTRTTSNKTKHRPHLKNLDAELLTIKAYSFSFSDSFEMRVTQRIHDPDEETSYVLL